MPYLDTTRTSTLTMDYSFTVANRQWQPGFLQPPEAEWTYKNHSLTMSGHLGFSAVITVSATAVPNSTDPPYPGGFDYTSPWNWKIYATIVCNNGHGVITTTNVDLYTGSSVSTSTNYIDWASTISGSLSCSVGTDVLWDITQTPQTEPPTISYVIWPPITAYRWYERSTTGSTAVTTLTVASTYGGGGSGSGTATGTVGSSRPTAAYNATIGSSGSISSPVSGSSTLAVTNVKVNNKFVKTYTHNHSYGSQAATMHSMTLTSVAGSIYSANGTISTTSYLTRYVALRGNYRSWKHAYSDSIRLNVYGFDYETTGYRALTASSGAVAGTDSLDNYSTTTTLNQSATTSPGSNDTLTTSLNQVPPSIYAISNTTDLTTNGELATESRFTLRGWRFNGMSTSHDATKAVTVTGLSNTYSNNFNMSAYRYLVIVLSSAGSGSGTFTLTTQAGSRTKVWNISWGSGSSNILLDLCAPPLESASVDVQDSPLPRLNLDMAHNATYLASEVQDGPYWGVTRISSAVVAVTTGSVPTFTSLTLTRNSINTTMNFVYPSRDYSIERITKAVVSEANTTTSFYARRFWQQDSNQRTEEESDVHWQVTVGGATGVTTTTIYGRTIINLVDDINATDAYTASYGNNVVRHNGWGATRSVAEPGGGTCSVSQPLLRDCYLNGDTGLASWIFGGGILTTPTSSPGVGSTFTYGFDILPGTHTAQTIFDSINGDFIPDIDDPFDVSTAATDVGGAIFEGLVLTGGVILRGSAHGIVLNSGSTATPNVGQTVNLLRASTSANRGTATTGTQGQFETQLPYAQNTVVNNAVFSTLTIPKTYYSGKHNRNAFRLTISTGVDLSSHNHDYSLMHLYSELSSTYSNRLTLYISPDNGNTWNAVDTGLSILSNANNGGHSIRLPFNSDSRKIWLTYINYVSPSTYTLVTRFSENEGITWSSMVTLASSPAYRPTTCVGANGFEYVFYYTGNSTVAGNSISAITRDTDNNVIQTAHTVVTSDAAFDVLSAYVRDTEIFLFYRKYSTNSVVVVKSTDMGNTFT